MRKGVVSAVVCMMISFGLVACCGGTTQSAVQKAASVAVGKVAEVYMDSGADYNPATFTVTDKRGNQPSIVIIKLRGKEKDSFNIMTYKLVELDGFKDLKGKQKMMGGLLILSPLQKRLVGKAVELTYTEATTKKGSARFLVTNVKFTSAAKPVQNMK